MCLHTSLPSYYFQCYKFLIKFKSCFRNAFCNFSFFLFSSLFSLLRAATFWFNSSICFSIAMFRISLLGSIIPACCSTAWFNLPAYLVLLAMPVQFSLYFFSDFPQSSCRICSYSSPHLARLIYMMSLILCLTSLVSSAIL